MKRWNTLGIGLVATSMACGWAGLAFGADEKQPPAGDRPRPEGREGREGGGGGFGGREGAQRPEPGRMLDRMREMYNEKLNLSDEQKKKVDAIVDKAKTDLEAAMKDSKDLEPRERGEKIRGVMGPVREALMDVLDSTQQEKLREEMKKQFGDRRPGGPDGPGFGGPPKDGEKPEARDGKRGPEGRDGRERRGEGRGEGRGDGRPGRPGGPDGPPRGGPREPGAMVEHLRDSLSKVGLNDEQKKKVDALLMETEKKLIDLRADAEKQAAETRGKFRDAIEAQHAKLEGILTSEQKEKLKEMMPRPDGGRGPDGRGGPEGRGRGPRGGGDGEGKRPPGPPPGDDKKPDKQ
jgi:hypothetical protein